MALSSRLEQPGGFGAYFFTSLAHGGPLEGVRPIPKAPERSWHASGLIFSLNHRFWRHFRQFSMFLAQLGNQVWAKTWRGPDLKIRTEPKLGLEPPTRPADSRTCFSEMPSLGLSLHNFMNFLDMRRATSRKKFRNGAQRKVSESAGLVGADLVVL